MSVFKCKMCGGTIEFENGATVGVCEYCGTKQTLPRLNDEQKSNLYDRANHFRRNNEYDKATAIYEKILNEDTTDSEAYWSLVLCRYGIEYVEDPSNHKRVPTINRTQFTSIYDDDNYKLALKYADNNQKEIYEKEANTINDIQKGILDISLKEEPFDVFICYKESDNNGRRTPDSVLANDLYHLLKQEGYKVFFSRITLEDKLGSAYEPYIFAALNSAKVMVVLGTRPEYFNAVWVKNEWSRYLNLVKSSNGNKVLIPAYRDMDPYDLPEEFSHLQALDMSKLGFMQDLIRGINKIIGSSKHPSAKEIVHTIENANVDSTLKRAFIFLEDNDWQEANNYFERALDQDPENAEAYLGKLMVDLKITKKEDFASLTEKFDENSNFKKIMRYGNEELKKEIADYAYLVPYNQGVQMMKDAKSISNLEMALSIFKSFPDYSLTESLIKECEYRINDFKKNQTYDQAIRLMKSEYAVDINNAIKLFESIIGFEDSNELIEKCKSDLLKIEETRKTRIYNDAKSLYMLSKNNLSLDMKKRYLEKAISNLKTIPDFEDSNILIENCQNEINTIFKNTRRNNILGGIFSIIIILGVLFALFINVFYDKAVSFYKNSDYNKAYEITRYLSLVNFKDSNLIYNNSYKIIKSVQNHIDAIKDLNVGSTVEFGWIEQDGDTSNAAEPIEWIVLDEIDDYYKYYLLLSKNAILKYTVTLNGTFELVLNNVFLNKSFSSEMIKFINDGYSGIKPSNLKFEISNTPLDKIFLFSTTEVENYLDNKDLKCKSSVYMSEWLHADEELNVDWLLRNHDDSYKGYYVTKEGSISTYENSYFIVGLRPAMWIKIKK